MNEALRLSDALRESHPYPPDIRQAAAELRRLHQFAEDQIGRATAAEAALQMTKATHALKIAAVEAQRDALLDWHANATAQLRAMHAALSAAEKTPRDPLEIEELWDKANELREKYGEYGPEVYELFARLLERAHGIGA